MLLVTRLLQRLTEGPLVCPEDSIRALNALGVTPRDTIAILEALTSAGALQAELEILAGTPIRAVSDGG
jgi:flagellar basal body P-ring protein FlgI